MRECRPLHKQAMPKVEQNGLGVTEKEDMETAQIEAREKEKKQASINAMRQTAKAKPTNKMMQQFKKWWPSQPASVILHTSTLYHDILCR